MVSKKKIHMSFEEYDYIFTRMKESCDKNNIPLILPNTMSDFLAWRDTILPQLLKDNPRQTVLWMCVLVDCGHFEDDLDDNSHLSFTKQKMREDEKHLIRTMMRKIINQMLELEYSEPC